MSEGLLFLIKNEVSVDEGVKSFFKKYGAVLISFKNTRDSMLWC